MPSLRQGDIFETAVSEGFQLAIIFGHIGYNELQGYWRLFRQTVPAWAEIDDPFSGETLKGGANEYQPGRYVWFVESHRACGLLDEEFAAIIKKALDWAVEQGMTKIITNGVNAPPTLHTFDNRLSDKQRTRLLAEIVSDYEQRHQLSITLMSLNDVFLR